MSSFTAATNTARRSTPTLLGYGDCGNDPCAHSERYRPSHIRLSHTPLAFFRGQDYDGGFLDTQSAVCEAFVSPFGVLTVSLITHTHLANTHTGQPVGANPDAIMEEIFGTYEQQDFAAEGPIQSIRIFEGTPTSNTRFFSFIVGKSWGCCDSF